MDMAFLFPDSLHSWNKIIKNQVQNGFPNEAIASYIHMQELNISPDNFTYPLLLKAVATLSLPKLVLGLHAQITKSTFHNHSFVQTALLNAYSSFGSCDDAWRVFKQISEKDIVAWNSMLYAFATAGEMDYALELFDNCPCKDCLSYNIMLSGYSRMQNVALAERFFNHNPFRDIVSWNTMISACCNVGDMKKAGFYFELMEDRNVITWNTMLTGYLSCGNFEDTISLFNRMIEENCVPVPDYLTITSVLSACASLGLLEKCEKVHVFALENGLTLSPYVTTSLIDTYSKCGRIMIALKVFYKSQIKDVFCWNAMISGLALHGHAFAAFKLFDEMRNNGVKPDDITFICLLNACSHAGLVQKGIELFNCMEREYHINPKVEHYGCIVDLLGRAGFLADAFILVESMPVEPGESILGALLGACVNHRDLEIGEKVMKLVLRKNRELSDGEFMMIANLYAACNQWEESNGWIKKMNDCGVTKTAGITRIEVNGSVCKFLAGNIGNCLENSIWI